jgi:hypothetical protein
MFNESWNMSQAGSLLSDELNNYSTATTQLQYYQNAMTALNGSGPWKNAYFYIYSANDIITRLQNNGNIPASVAAQLIGEAKFVRAFWYFYLTNLYGDVPLELTTDYTINGSMARTPQVQVYQQVIKDLQDAQAGLNSNYVDASDTTITTERSRPTKGAAVALLARVYLYTQKYDSAEIAANLTINNSSLYKLCTNLSASTGSNYVFQKNSTETIWQLATPLPATTFTVDALDFTLRNAPGTGAANSAIVSPQLLNSFEPSDKRRTQWIGIYPTTGAGVKYNFPYKYQVYNTTSVTSSTAISEYTMVLRLAEQYLIRAEARAQQGNIMGSSGALADLNIIRNRAGLPNYTGAMDQASVLAAILHERRVEFFAEWGHRWFDLKRTGTIDAVMGGTGGVCAIKGGSWSSTDQLFPIPQVERTNNANLTQNSGY